MFPFRSRKRPRPAARYRPQVLALEDRVLLTTIPVDSLHTLQAALQSASILGGDVIQIEPSATIATLSLTGGTVVAPTAALDTTITVTKFISPAEIINIGTDGTADNNVLVDGEMVVGPGFLLTLHSPLAHAHAIGETITPVANTIGIGKAVTVQGDPNDPAFAFPNPFFLELFAATVNSPVTLRNLNLSAGSGTPLSGTAAGDLNLSSLRIATGSGTGFFANVGGNATVSNSTISTGSGTAFTASVAVDETISNSTITTASGTALTSNVTGNETIRNSTITTASGTALTSNVSGNDSVSNSTITTASGTALTSNVTGNETIRNSTITTASGTALTSNVTGNETVSYSTITTASGTAVSCNVMGNETVSHCAITTGGGAGLSSNVTGTDTVSNSSIAVGSGIGISDTVSGGKLESILNNVISTSAMGTGLQLSGTSTSQALVQGNDFRGNLIGVQDTGDNVNAGSVDLGGGAFGSLGGNDFRGYPAGGAGGSFAIALTKTSASATVSARDNIWSLDGLGNVIDPRTVIQDGSHNTGATGTGIIDVGVTQLTPNEEYVQTLYRTFLGRSGNIPLEVDFWANQVPAKGAAAVADAIAREQSFKGAFIKLVDGFYELLLARQADSGGESYWVNLLAGGATEEQVIEGFVTVPEFAQRNVFLSTTSNSDAGFVQALYCVLLHRSVAQGNLTQDVINAGVIFLEMKGRAGLAADLFTGSGDFQLPDGSTFRQVAVRSFYGNPTLSPLPWEFFLPNLLHRKAAPAAVEVAFWANSSLDLLSIELGIAGAPENFSNG